MRGLENRLEALRHSRKGAEVTVFGTLCAVCSFSQIGTLLQAQRNTVM
jgi:hypothetical protein